MPPERVTLLAATGLEARALRRHAPRAQIVECGIGLSRLRGGEPFAVAISCGLAGGLRGDLPTGTVVIPDVVETDAGARVVCDVEWTGALRAAASALGLRPIGAPLLTSGALVTGAERERWARRGFAAVDMETGALAAARVAAVRVILDTPLRELSPDWMHPLRALLHPRNWAQAMWLAREGSRCADLAARVAGCALERA